MTVDMNIRGKAWLDSWKEQTYRNVVKTSQIIAYTEQHTDVLIESDLWVKKCVLCGKNGLH